jgi:multiple sugar transport system substrate-binding protein
MNRFNRIILFMFIALLLSLSMTVSAAQEPVTLDLWMFLDGTGFLPSVVEAFQAQNPHITIQITDIPEDEYATKVDTAFLAGEPPDIGFPLVDRWLQAGYFLPLDDAMTSAGVGVDDYNAGAISRNCTQDGRIYCVGTYTGGTILFYNKDLFDAANIPYPSATEAMSIDQYADIAMQLAVFSENIEERVWGGASPATWWFDTRNYVSEDGRTADGFVNDEATAHTYQVIADLYASGAVITEADASMVVGETSDLLASGQLAMGVTDSVLAQPLLDAAGIRWGAAPPPVEQAGDPAWVYTGSDELGVFLGTDYPEEAIDFVIFWGTEGNRMRAEVDGLPLNMRLAEELNWAGESEGRQEMFAAIQISRPSLFVPEVFSAVFDPIAEAFNGLILEDGLSAQDALNEIAPIAQDNLDQAWETWDQIQPVQ